MSMRIVPSASHPPATHLSFSAPSAPGVHDTLRATLNPSHHHSLAPTPNTSTTPLQLDSNHPLETRLKAWNATQESLKLNTLRRTFGVAEPIRRGMELKIVRAGEWRPAVLGGSAGVSSDILAGRDADCAWEDVFVGGELRGRVGFHEEMERIERVV